MNCPKCKTSNPAGSKFCEKCGAKLEASGGEISFKAPKIPKISLPGISAKLIIPIVVAILVIIAGLFGYQKLTNKPEAVVKSFFSALGKSDLTKALALVVPEERLEAKASLDSFLSSISRLDITKIRVKNVVISDEEASVDVDLDFELKLKDGKKFTYLSSKGTMIIYDGKTKVEVPLTESNKYSEAKILTGSINLEKIKGKWYIKAK